MQKKFSPTKILLRSKKLPDGTLIPIRADGSEFKGIEKQDIKALAPLLRKLVEYDRRKGQS